MFFQVEGDGSRPTYFELSAAEQLPASLKAATLYVLGVMAQRHPRLHRVLDFGDEFYALVQMLLEWHSLRTHDASFGETLFALKRDVLRQPSRSSSNKTHPRVRHSRAADGSSRGGSAAAAAASSDGAASAPSSAAPLTIAAVAAAAAGGSASAPAVGLSRRLRLMSLLFLVVVPYLKSKLHSAYVERRQEQQAAAMATLWDDGDVQDSGNDVNVDDASSGRRSRGSSSNGSPWSLGGLFRRATPAATASTPVMRPVEGSAGAAPEEVGAARDASLTGSTAAEVGQSRSQLVRWLAGFWQWQGDGGRMGARERALARNRGPREVLVDAVVSAYPWIHTGYEGVLFVYQLLYALDATPYYSPWLHISGLWVRRSTPQELRDSDSSIERRRRTEYERLPGPSWMRGVTAAVIRSAYFALDYSQAGIIGGVFLFKMMEWWYQTGEQRLTTQTVYPPPPPPPPPPVAEGGLPLPTDRKLCPLCLNTRTNPTMPAVSGFVFCYPCIFAYVDQYKRCPVTHIPTEVGQLRRLFHAA